MNDAHAFFTSCPLNEDEISKAKRVAAILFEDRLTSAADATAILTCVGAFVVDILRGRKDDDQSL